MTKKIPFILTLRKEAISTSTFTTKTTPWKSGDVIVISQIAVCNNDTDSKIAHVGIIRGDLAIYYETLVLTKAAYFYPTSNPIVIPSDYRIIIKFVTPADGDQYYINVIGYIETDVENE